ncbi:MULTISPECIES: hypothetical protein [Listeria]|nr:MULTISPECIES: hypothetical protein [Listeria]
MQIFEGTSFRFKFTYFITAMAPAYILFGLQVQMQQKAGDDATSYWVIGTFLLISVCMLFCLKKLLNKRYKEKSGLNLKLTIKNKRQIVKKNGDVVAFLMGTILPSVLVIDGHTKETLVIFVILQVLIFILTTRSSNVFPNIVLMLAKVDIYELDDGKYILTLNERLKTSESSTMIVSLGDSEFCNTYLIAEENRK